ncbi:hypothetical protein [Paraburkholderia oxyphila]|uniref:hypothetical protein n=1 Tax=Paraburkholderia oxyphila TaxID=614212 RepID=UPI0012EDCDB4|nr:hypothetical protein [Paraburkholderia oxyphila]
MMTFKATANSRQAFAALYPTALQRDRPSPAVTVTMKAILVDDRHFLLTIENISVLVTATV